jgi:Gpi18-like mannosyltransferase
VVFLLLWLAIAAWLMRSDRQFAAGMILSLCSAKFHLFFLLPLLIVGKRLWRMAAGLAAGGALLVALSSVVAGPRWLAAYWQILRDTRIEPHPWEMVNLRAALHGVPGAAYWEAGLAISAAVACWVIVRRAEFPVAISALVTAGLLISRHSYAPDASLLLLPALTVPFLRQSSIAKVLAVAPMIPLTWFVGVAPGWYRLPRLVPLLLLYALALEKTSSRGGTEAETRRHRPPFRDIVTGRPKNS